MGSPTDDPYVTTDDVARMFHVSVGTVLNWSYAGHLPNAVKVGRRLLWRRSVIEAWAADMSSAQHARKRYARSARP